MAAPSGGRPRMGLSKPLRLGVLVIAAAAVVTLLIVFNPLAMLPKAESNDAVRPPRDRGEIALADLSSTLESEGELRLAQQREVSAVGGAGMLTAVMATGQPVSPLGVLYEIDGVPTVALTGEVPAWRTMTVDDVGRDVAQLEMNLVALGYDPDGELTVDDTFTISTAAVVERWQEDLGVAVTGSIGFGSIVFVPADSTVSTVSAVVGSAVQAAPLLSVASTKRELVFPVAAEQLDTIGFGTEVSARLPDRSTVTATVVALGPAGPGQWEAAAEISPSSAAEVTLPEGDAIPLTVSWVESIATGAKTVRANALTRLDSGTYAVEVVDAGGGTEFVPVEIGARSGSTIEVITDLEVGTVIIAP